MARFQCCIIIAELTKKANKSEAISQKRSSRTMYDWLVKRKLISITYLKLLLLYDRYLYAFRSYCLKEKGVLCWKICKERTNKRTHPRARVVVVVVVMLLLRNHSNNDNDDSRRVTTTTHPRASRPHPLPDRIGQRRTVPATVDGMGEAAETCSTTTFIIRSCRRKNVQLRCTMYKPLIFFLLFPFGRGEKQNIRPLNLL